MNRRNQSKINHIRKCLGKISQIKVAMKNLMINSMIILKTQRIQENMVEDGVVRENGKISRKQEGNACPSNAIFVTRIVSKPQWISVRRNLEELTS